MTRYRRIDPEITRRKFVNWALGVAAGITGLSFVTIVGSAKPVNRETPDKLPPAEGDILVYADGAQVGKPIDPKNLEPQPTRAYPQAKSGDGQPLVKSGDTNNLLLVSKFPEAQLKEPTDLESTAQGIVVYSAICQHLGCPVNWRNVDQTYLCPCHSGVYDPKQGCKVIGGPPPAHCHSCPSRSRVTRS